MSRKATIDLTSQLPTTLGFLIQRGRSRRSLSSHLLQQLQVQRQRAPAMADKGVKVFGMWASPMVIRVEWALRLKGVEYEYVDEDLENKSEALLRYNPVTKKVPVLVHDGKPLAESTVIVEYIDEAWKGGYPIMPADPFERAQARFWARFAEEKCNAALYPIFMTTGEAQSKLVKEAQQCLKTLETALEGKKFFGGDAFGYLDIVTGWYAYWLPIIEEVTGVAIITDEALPLIKAWFDRVVAVDAVKATLPPRDKLVALNKARREQFLSA